MTETRTLEQITKEYTNLIPVAGQTQYQIEVYKVELAAINKKLLELNNEAAALKQERKNEKSE